MITITVCLLRLCLLLVSSTRTNAATETTTTLLCDNTVGGRWNLTDSTGRVCGRHEMDFSTGCCPEKSTQHSCESCMERDGCCSSYEHCVSCCMAPRHAPAERMKEVYIGLFKPDTGHWSNEFTYCKAACRTTSRSTEHENAFIGERRFCFSEDRRPRETDPVTFETMDTFIAKGSPDVSCTDVCTQQKSTCVSGDEDMQAKINTCDELRQYFPCEAGCFEYEGSDHVFPGYVSNNAKKEENPATCYISSSPSSVDTSDEKTKDACKATSGPVHRLCVCSRSQDHDDVQEE